MRPKPLTTSLHCKLSLQSHHLLDWHSSQHSHCRTMSLSSLQTCMSQHHTQCTRLMQDRIPRHTLGIATGEQQQIMHNRCIPIQNPHSYIQSGKMSTCSLDLFRNSIFPLSDTIQHSGPLCMLRRSYTRSMHPRQGMSPKTTPNPQLDMWPPPQDW